MAVAQAPYALFNIMLFFNNQRLKQGSYRYNPNVTGEDLIQLSNEMQGLPQVSKIDPLTIIRSITINPTVGSETYRILEKYRLKEVYSNSLDFEKELSFNDGMQEITSSNAFILPPDEYDFSNLATQGDWRIIFYNAKDKDLT